MKDGEKMADTIKKLVEDGLFPNPIAMLVQLLATAILLFFLYKFAYKPIMNMLAKRQELIDKEINDAKQANLEAKNLNEEAAVAITEAKNKADLIVNDAVRKADEKSSEILQATKEEVNYKLKKDQNLEQAHQEDMLSNSYVLITISILLLSIKT